MEKPHQSVLGYIWSKNAKTYLYPFNSAFVFKALFLNFARGRKLSNDLMFCLTPYLSDFLSLSRPQSYNIFNLASQSRNNDLHCLFIILTSTRNFRLLHKTLYAPMMHGNQASISEVNITYITSSVVNIKDDIWSILSLAP